jgi:hypothetical protein
MRNVFRPEPKPESIEPDAPASKGLAAWQPFTFRGVAAFAKASYPRLFWVQTFFAILCASAVVWALTYCWTPVIRSAVRNLPNEAPVRAGQLVYPPSATPLLAESRHLALLLNPEGTSAASDVRIELHATAVRVCSLLGCLVRAYPQGQAIHVTRAEAIPWWDAWEPIFLGIVAVVCGLAFLAMWTLLASIVFPFVRLYAYFADRQLNFGGAWRLSAAAFLPGTVALIAALVLYAVGTADLIRFALAIPLHLLIAVVYLARAPLKLDRIPAVAAPSVNPFTAEGERDKTSAP